MKRLLHIAFAALAATASLGFVGCATQSTSQDGTESYQLKKAEGMLQRSEHRNPSSDSGAEPQK